MSLVFNKNSDSDSDGPMLKQALPINTDLEIDESRPASTAEEYLLRVRNQRQKLPKISYAKMDTIKDNIKNAKQSIAKNKCYNRYTQYFESSSQMTKDLNPALLPKNEWRQQFVTSFKSKRDVLINEIVDSSKWGKRRKNMKNCEYSKYAHLDIPYYHHRDKWIKFALNVTKFRRSLQTSLRPKYGNVPKILRTENGYGKECEDESEFAVPPLLTIMEQLSPIETEKLLQFFVEFVIETQGNEEELNGMACLWIYALFLRIETPLRAQLTANIREFARFWIKKRNQLNVNESSALIVVANIFIVIIEDVFKQPIT